MIVEKLPLPDDPVPPDEPPSYDTLPVQQRRNDSPLLLSPAEKSSTSSATGSSSSPQQQQQQQRPPAITTTAGKSPRAQSTSFSRPSSSKAKAKGWFNFSSSRNTREVRQTVLGLVRGLVRQQQRTSTSYETLGILESCADACASYDLSLSSLLQEPFIEGHTPLYWAIIKRPPETSTTTTTTTTTTGTGTGTSEDAEDAMGVPDFLTTLISFSDPLASSTKSEMRLACLLTSDQALFQRLRLSPEFSPLSGTDQILLGASMPPDGIVVGDVPGDEGSFVVHFEIVQFQQRMRVSKRIGLEFIARGRMWCLSFSIASHTTNTNTNTSTAASSRWSTSASPPKPGSWCLTLALLEHSPPTWIDSRLLIEEPRFEPPSPLASIPRLVDVPSTSSSSPSPVQSPRQKPKPTICLRLKTGSTQLIAPPSSSESSCSTNESHQNEIVVSLDDSMMGASLQYDGSSYIALDGTLRARLEGRLAKPEAECIIC